MSSRAGVTDGFMLDRLVQLHEADHLAARVYDLNFGVSDLDMLASLDEPCSHPPLGLAAWAKAVGSRTLACGFGPWEYRATIGN